MSELGFKRIPFKTCAVCGKRLPASPEFFPLRMSAPTGICHACVKRLRQYGVTIRHEMPENLGKIVNLRLPMPYSQKRLNMVTSTAVSNALSGRLRRAGPQRYWPEESLGYTVGELRGRFESLFRDGMDWSNYGMSGWVTDHLIPKTAFSYTFTSDLEFRQCWALENLQPLWADESSVKSSKIFVFGEPTEGPLAVGAIPATRYRRVQQAS